MANAGASACQFGKRDEHQRMNSIHRLRRLRVAIRDSL
jgi:hypothetical protein